MDIEPPLQQSEESNIGMQQGSDQYEYGTAEEGESIKLNDIIQKLSDYERVMKIKENKTKINDERMRHKLKETEDKLTSEKAARMIDREESTAKVKILETELRKQEQAIKMKTKEMKSKEEMMRAELKKLEDALSVERTARKLEHEDLNTKVKRLETELREQETKISSKEENEERMKVELQMVIDEVSSQKEARELEHKYLTANITELETKLRTEIKKKDTTIKELDKKNKKLDRTLIDVERKLDGQKTANIELCERQIIVQQLNDTLKKELKETRKIEKEQKAEITQKTSLLNQQDVWLRQQGHQIQQQDQHIQQYISYSNKLKKDLDDSEEKRHELTLRLIKLAGAQLTSNNLNIADLSHTNRPTKLAEKYSELYDKEWTDAYEDLSEWSGTDEQTRINKLLKLLKASYDECVQLSEPFRDTLRNLTTVTLREKGHQESRNRDEIKQNQETTTTAIDKSVQTSFDHVEPGALTAGKIDIQEFPEISGRRNMHDEYYMASNETETGQTFLPPPRFSSNVDTGEITADVTVQMEFTAEQRKLVSVMMNVCRRKLEEEMGLSKVIAQKIALERNIDAEKHKPIVEYITKCAELCWFMMIQEPPVFIGFNDAKTGEPFNKDVYKAYTKTGKQLDYIVWPPLYLYEDGPMLYKGVAQGAN